MKQNESKMKLARILLGLAEDVSSDTETAKNYLREQGIDPDKVVEEGIEKLRKITSEREYCLKRANPDGCCKWPDCYCKYM